MSLLSQLHFVGQKPTPRFWESKLKLDPKSTVIFYDQKLKNHPTIKTLLKKYSFAKGIKGGEGFKTLENTEKLGLWVHQLKGLNANPKSLNFVSIGGGSIGDAIGFLASVFKRGVRWVNVPSTWLSAVDSAHGGKTAVNLSGVKNQLGSFYRPSDVLIVKDILFSQPKKLTQQSMGEVAKTVLLKPRKFNLKSENRWDQELVWKNLKKLIEVKYEIVQQDPFETKGKRYLLNWGHTYGHIFETHFQWHHGESVGQGLAYELYLAHRRGYISADTLEDRLKFLKKRFAISPKPSKKKLTKGVFTRLVLQDKKAQSNDSVKVVLSHSKKNFVVEPVSVNELWENYQLVQKECFS